MGKTTTGEVMLWKLGPSLFLLLVVRLSGGIMLTNKGVESRDTLEGLLQKSLEPVDHVENYNKDDLIDWGPTDILAEEKRYSGKRAPMRFGKRAPMRFGKRAPMRFGKREYEVGGWLGERRMKSSKNF